MLNSTPFSWVDQEINTLIGPDFCFSTAKKHPANAFKLILDSCWTWAGCKLLMLLRQELGNADFVVPKFDMASAFFH
jgi:hypothetical protein